MVDFFRIQTNLEHSSPFTYTFVDSSTLSNSYLTCVLEKDLACLAATGPIVRYASVSELHLGKTEGRDPW